jgi:uncharacterized RDD family membrane protein YckC
MDWYYLKNGRQFGPVPETSIRAWLESGFLTAGDLLWRSGMPDWAPAGEQPEFAGAAGASWSDRSAGLPGGVPYGSSPIPPPAGASGYAGFWMRAGAYIVDSLLMSVVLAAAWLPRLIKNPDPEKLREDIGLLAASFILSWLYFALMESSPLQATLGKRAFHLRVTDLEGKRITFARASLRQWAKLISGLIFYAGYVLAGFTPRKQALHDLLAGCLVVRE